MILLNKIAKIYLNEEEDEIYDGFGLYTYGLIKNIIFTGKYNEENQRIYYYTIHTIDYIPEPKLIVKYLDFKSCNIKGMKKISKRTTDIQYNSIEDLIKSTTKSKLRNIDIIKFVNENYTKNESIK